ncbi:MAG: hypothetical protein IPK26_31085 [Planctomycetes bacterium]|nr:hypothetical protein [Planctomycetota bacterium]
MNRATIPAHTTIKLVQHELDRLAGEFSLRMHGRASRATAGRTRSRRTTVPPILWGLLLGYSVVLCVRLYR